MEGIESAYNELKRVDHLIFVTLKYTRTVDIIRSVIERLISTIDFAATEALEQAEEKEKISRVPPVALMRCKKLEEVFPKDDTVMSLVDFYCMLRKLMSSDYKRKEEYRKNVALVTRDQEVNIETLREYADLTKYYVDHIKEKLEEEA
jgi:hypothetical protein